MLHRKILIICDSEQLRLQIRHYLLTELSDVRLTEAETPEDALARLATEYFEVVIFEFAACADFWPRMRRIVAERMTVFVPVASAPDAERLRQLGIAAIAVPCDAQTLAAEVNHQCNPRGFRQHLRVSLPGAKAYISVNDYRFRGEIINIGLGGVLCDIPMNPQYKMLLDAVQIQIPARETLGPADLDLTGRFTRMTLMNAAQGGGAETVMVAWRFVGMSDAQQEILSVIIDSARQSLAE